MSDLEMNMPTYQEETFAQLEIVTAQRDQLLEVLEMVRDSGDWFASALELNMDVDGGDLLAVIEKSIAAVKGEK